MLGNEKRIGNIAHKSSPVFFYLQKETTFEKDGQVLPFELERLNIGGAMNFTTGTFTAPVSGIYHFAFSGRKNDKGGIYINLRVNDEVIGAASSGRHNASVTLSLLSTLRLRTGDRVDLFTFYYEGGMLYDDSISHYTHFSGWLLEEDLMFQ